MKTKKAVFYIKETRGMYIGRLEKIVKRTGIPSTLLVSLEDELELIDPIRRNIVKAKSFLVPAGVNVEINTHGANIALFCLDPMGRDYSRLAPLMHSVLPIGNKHCLSEIKGEAHLIELANILLNQRPSFATAEQHINDCLDHAPQICSSPDPRIARAVELLATHCDRNISVDWIAQQIHLSAPRLTQLFKEVVGIPIRRFRLWQRMFAAGTNFAKGVGLTEAALAAGFSDYSHCSHTYRHLAGGNPYEASRNTEIIVGGHA